MARADAGSPLPQSPTRFRTRHCLSTGTPGRRAGIVEELAIESVARDGKRALITLRHRPGFRLADGGETVVMTHHPLMEIPGRPTWRLPNVVRLRGAD